MVNCLFVGKEVEGPERGELTLFIPKNASNRRLFLIEAKKLDIKRLYFGAGNDRGIRLSSKLLLDIPSDYKVYLEIVDYFQLADLPLEFLKRTQIIYVIIQKYDINILPSVFKIERSTDVRWFDLPASIKSDINDDLYKKDEIIE